MIAKSIKTSWELLHKSLDTFSLEYHNIKKNDPAIVKKVNQLARAHTSACKARVALNNAKLRTKYSPSFFKPLMHHITNFSNEMCLKKLWKEYNLRRTLHASVVEKIQTSNPTLYKDLVYRIQCSEETLSDIDRIYADSYPNVPELGLDGIRFLHDLRMEVNRAREVISESC